ANKKSESFDSLF
ncbi:N-acetylglucosamine-6-phosphate deacetylase, partial [Haemophilus influenzae]